MLTEREIYLVTLFRQCNELERLTVVSLLEKQAKLKKRKLAFALIQGGVRDLDQRAGGIQNDGSPIVAARSV